jgi:predicted 3-demethylubiquinone-9 3-methyltransferase (glyoxalase superfamily)
LSPRGSPKFNPDPQIKDDIMTSIAPCLWFNGEAEDAAKLYVSLFPDASIGNVSRYGDNMPFPAGTALMVEFTVFGQRYQALNGGPQFTHSEAISLSISCADQAEVDHYWQALTAHGGSEGQCGWCKDRWGISWQIVPSGIAALMMDPDPARRARATQAMMGMKKLDLAALQAAADAN